MSLFYDLLFFTILFFKYIGIPVGLILLITWCIIKCIREAKKHKILMIINPKADFNICFFLIITKKMMNGCTDYSNDCRYKKNIKRSISYIKYRYFQKQQLIYNIH